jgi:mono/diheme cytochrome c family protein
MKTIRVLLVLIGVEIVLVIGAVFVVVYSGAYNVAADKPHTRLVEWVLETARDHSVERHAKGITAPDLTSAAMIQEGLAHYHENCVVCHGGPGLSPTEIAKGLNPPAPNLSDSAKEMSAAELFWITQHGIKMTGMPAFGVTHSKDKIWAIVAFLKQLPTLSPQAYKAEVQALPKQGPNE